MEQAMTHILALILTFFISHEAQAQNLTCDASLSAPLCPGTVASCICNVNGIISSTRWIFTAMSPCQSPFNFISLNQLFPCFPPAPSSSGTCGPYLSAANFPSMSSCQTSMLNITANPSLDGLGIECRDTTGGNPGTLVGTRNISIVGLPGSPSALQPSGMCTNSFSIQWLPPAGGYNATSYNVSIINGTYSLVAFSNNATVEDLVDGTTYTVRVSSVNCAGPSSNSSNVTIQTLPCAPVGINVTTILYQNNSVHDVELFWTHRQNCSVPQYTVVVTSNTSTDMSAVSTSYCNTSSCSYVQNISEGNISSYTVSVACRNRLNQTGQPYVTTQSVLTPVLGVGQLNVSGNTATLNCTFLDGSSYYCLVCCSSDPTVPAGSRGYMSSTKGTSVSVSLQSLSSNQTYYCKAAATNTNTLNCGGPVVGGVKLFFSFLSGYRPITSSSSNIIATSASPGSTQLPKDNNALTGGQIAGIVIGIVVGVLILVALLVVLVVVIVVVKCIKPSKYSPSKEQTDTAEMRDILKKESSATPERTIEGHEVYDTLQKRDTNTEATSTFKETANAEPTKYADLQPLQPTVEINIPQNSSSSVQYSGVIV